MYMTKDEQLEVISSAIDSYAGWFPDDDEDDREARKSIDEARDQILDGVVPDCDNAMNDHIDEIQGRENIDLDDRANDNIDMGEALYVQGYGGASNYVLVGRAMFVLDNLNTDDGTIIDPDCAKDLTDFAKEDYDGDDEVMKDVHNLVHSSKVSDGKKAFSSLCDDVGIDPL